MDQDDPLVKNLVGFVLWLDDEDINNASIEELTKLAIEYANG